MRISDWSSDVCASDLLAWFAYLVGILRGFVHLLADDLGGDLVEMGGEGTAQFLKLWPKRHLDEAGRGTDNDGLTVHPRCAEDQIGRASCRERVCQYVEISVVAGSLKKTKNTTS